MSRAAVTYKSKQQLAKMDPMHLDEYIRWLRLRVDVLGGPAGKSTAKLLAVAEKIRESLDVGTNDA